MKINKFNMYWEDKYELRIKGYIEDREISVSIDGEVDNSDNREFRWWVYFDLGDIVNIPEEGQKLNSLVEAIEFARTVLHKYYEFSDEYFPINA